MPVGSVGASEVSEEVCSKNLIWTLPALFLMRHFSDELAFPFKGIYRYRRQNSPYLLIAVLMTVAVVGGSILRHHGFSLSPSFKGADLLIVLFVGISEETVFRGFLLNATLKYADTTFKKGLAAGINSILFLLIHFPVWITSGTFVSNFTSMSFLSVVLLSVLFSYCFIKCKNCSALEVVVRGLRSCLSARSVLRKFPRKSVQKT